MGLLAHPLPRQSRSALQNQQEPQGQLNLSLARTSPAVPPKLQLVPSPNHTQEALLTISMTMDLYAHLYPEDMQNAAAQFGEYLVQ